MRSAASSLQNISTILADHFREFPDQVIVIHSQTRQKDQLVTYRDLMLGAAGYAQRLAASGIKKGDVVILLLNRERDLLYSFFGTILSGAIPSIMPFLTEKLAPEHYRQSITALFEKTRPGALIAAPELIQELETAAHNSDIRTILQPDLIDPAEEIDFARLPGMRSHSQEIVLLQHSSGTTGLQKGVALSHRSVFNQLESYAKALHLSLDDVIVSWLPLYHDMGLIAGFILPVLTRTPLILMSPFDWVRAPYRLFQAITRYRGTLCWMPNFAYNFCSQKIRDRDLEDVDLSSLRAVINCSEPIHWKSHQMFIERFTTYGLHTNALATSYAMAENVFAVTQSGIQAPLTTDRIDAKRFQSDLVAYPATGNEHSLNLVSSGRPIENTQVRVIDKDGNTLPDRTIGEISIQSNCMLNGYYNRPELNKRAFLNGWYLTGDLGYLADGELYVTGRKKDLIIVGGKNIYPQDLERLADEVPGVHPGRVVAFGVFNEATGTEDVVLLSEVDTKDRVEQQKIADQIRDRVNRGSDVALRYVRVLDRGWLLKTSSGKVARSANRDKYIQELNKGG